MTKLASARAHVSVAGLDPEAAGVTPPTDPDRRTGFLTDVVVELGFADRETVEKAEEASRSSAQTIERSLLGSGALDEEQLARAIAERNGLDHVDLDRFDVDMEAAEMVSRSTALRYRAVPIAFAADGALIVAVEDPFDSLGICDIEAMTRSEVRPVIATASGIHGLIERLSDEPAVQAPPPAQGQDPTPPHEQAPAPFRPEQRPESPAAVPPEPQAEPPAGREPEPQVVPEPEPEPTPQAAPQAEPTPESTPTEGGDRRGRAADLDALRDAVRRADALATAVGQRIGELEGADERARGLERELAAAGERIAALEERLSRVSGAAGEALAAIEKLGALQRALEETGP